MTATFGDFLRPAGEHVAAAISIRDEIPAEATFGVIRQFGHLLSTLAAMAAEPLSPEAQTVLDARIALRRGAQSLRYAMNTLRDAVSDDSHPAVQHLSAAAGFLSAGRDLLQTHFASNPGGTRQHQSTWAPVITSPPVTAALLGEIAECALRMAPWTARLSMPEATQGTFRQAPAWQFSPRVTARGSREPRCRPRIDATLHRLTRAGCSAPSLPTSPHPGWRPLVSSRSAP